MSTTTTPSQPDLAQNPGAPNVSQDTKLGEKSGASDDTKTTANTEEEHPQILKSREDQTYVVLVPYADDDDRLVVKEGSTCSWLQNQETISKERIRKRIEPWLTALCQSEHLSLLVGSGLTHAVHWMAAKKGLPGMSKADFGNSKLAERIASEAKRSAKAAKRSEGNFEDEIRVANELIRGLEIMGNTCDKASPPLDELRKRRNLVLKNFAESILQGEAGIAEAEEDERERAFNYLVTFLMSFASRSGTRDRLHIFTTNYDRLIEAGADAAGLHLLDRFVGALAPVFRSLRLDLDIHYNPPGIRGEPRYLEGVARFTKLHGSVDWVDASGAIRKIGLPFGAKDVASFLNAPGLSGEDIKRLMIYPNAAKDKETAGYPYVDLFRDLAASCCRPNHTLFTYGYSFGDDHINRVIEDMLTIPSTHLVIIAHGDPLKRIMGFYDSVGRPAQVSLMIGDRLGDLTQLVDWYLPKPAIDRTTFRMADLLKARFGTSPTESPHEASARVDGAGSDDDKGTA